MPHVFWQLQGIQKPLYATHDGHTTIESLHRLSPAEERVLAADEPVGRRLDFLMQELNREANTLSSKSVVADTTRCAVELKVLIEQMREQVQNIE